MKLRAALSAYFDRARQGLGWRHGVIALVCALVLALPLAHERLPMVDLPQHLAQNAIAAHNTDSRFGTSAYYQLTGHFLPYLGYRTLHIAIERLVHDDLLAGRIALAPALLLALLALLAIARLTSRASWVAIAGATLLVDANFLWGFAPYTMAHAMMLTQLATVLAWIHSTSKNTASLRWSVGYPVLTSLLGVAMFFTHIQPTILALITLTVLALWAHRRRLWSARHVITLGATLLPAATLSVTYLVAGGWLSGQRLEDEFRIHPPTVWHHPLDVLRWIPLSSGLVVTGIFPLVCFAIVALGVMLGARATRHERTPSQPSLADAPRVLVLTWVSLALALPAEFRGQSIAPRLTPLVLLGLLLLPRMRASVRDNAHPRWTRGLQLSQGIIAFGALSSLVYSHVMFVRFDQQTHGIATLVRMLPPRARVASLVYDPHLEGFRLPVLLHASAYGLVARGGMSSMGFTRTGVTYRPEVPRQTLTVRELWAPYVLGTQLNLHTHGAYYDAVFVVRGARYRGTPFGPGSDAHVRAFRVAAEGRFELWRVEHLRTP
ncbi:MAG: hypothetical protein Q8Q09_13315 [Deltaproteobacteria bacterium]|nr:hypothetical protein [Deltaproteobacteria bacterium]